MKTVYRFFVLKLFALGFFFIGTLAQNNPVELQVRYVGEAFSNVAGGIQTGSTYLGLIDLGISAETEKLGFWEGGTFNVLMESTHGGTPSAQFIGDMQVASNIENGNYTYIYELSYYQRIKNLEIQLGLLDLNASCHVAETGGLFLNSSFGIMPTASLNMPVPIFPIPALGVQLNYQLSDRTNLLAAVWDGDPGDFETNPFNTKWTLNREEGFLYALEGAYKYSLRGSERGCLKLGALYHSGSFPNVINSDLSKDGNLELHAIAEFTLSKSKEDQRKRTTSFLQLGFMPDQNYNTLPLYIGAGMNSSGLLFKDSRDVFGLAVGYSRLSPGLYTLEADKEYELTLEMTYALPITDFIIIQPDIQYIVNPGGMNEWDNALVGFLRIIVEQ